MKVIAMANKRQNLKQGNTQLRSSVYIYLRNKDKFIHSCFPLCVKKTKGIKKKKGKEKENRRN